MELVGFADDATGAMDVAGSLHSRGYSVRVTMEGTFSQASDMIEVANLSNRYDNPEISAEKLTAALHDARVQNYGVQAFLKIDSTLRGNLAISLETLEGSNGDKPLFIAPAFPFYGRTCLNGIYLVKGRPIHTTEFAKDRKFQVGSSEIGNHFPNTSHIGWATLDGGIAAVLEAVEQSASRAFTFDTRNQIDLEIIAESGLAANASMIGSSGLARAFPRKDFTSPDHYNILNLPTLFVIGSINSMSRTQKELLASETGTEVQVKPSSAADSHKALTTRQLVLRYLEAGTSVCLTTPDTKFDDPRTQIQLEGALGDSANIDEIPHNLVIVGGETVRATLRAKGIGSLILKGEYEAGIPIATQADSTQEAIVTKAGSFGHSNTLVNIHHFLRRA